MGSILANFAVLEGCDGSGTSTQLEMLKTRFAAAADPSGAAQQASGLPPLYATAEPSTGPIGELIRRALKGAVILRAESLARLFAADRCEHLYGKNGIADYCAAGLVVSDRYSPSSLVYQAIECGKALPESLNAAFPLPELLLYLDIDADTASKRIESRNEREIYEYTEFQQKVREGYRELLPDWEKAGVRVVSIDAAKKPGEVAAEVWAALCEMPIMKKHL
jgi:dTMP kinase